MESKQLNIRLSSEEITKLGRIADSCEVNPSTLAAFFLRASLRAHDAYGKRMLLPPQFQIVEHEPVAFGLNEPAEKLSSKRK